MKIDTSKIENYADMTAEQKLAALEGFEYEDNASKLAELTETNAKNKAALDKALKQVGELTKAQREKMTEDEKAKADADAREKELAELKADKAKRDAIDVYMENYGAYGMTRELAEKHYDTKDPQIIKDLMDAYAKKVKEEAENGKPDPNAGHKRKDGDDFIKPTRTFNSTLDREALGKFYR